MTALRDAALAAVDAGYSVIPLTPRSKVPMASWKPYQTTRAMRAQVDAWWRAEPLANLGIVTGSVSGLSVLDLDPRNDPTGETVTWLVSVMPPPTVITPSGWHWYIAECWPTIPRLRPGLDLKGQGGYVLAPPSIHPSGRLYERLCDGFARVPEAVREVIEVAVRDRRHSVESHNRRPKPSAADDDQLTMREVLSLLAMVRPTARGWLARCPAHDDGRPSLTVGYGHTQAVVVKCWAGCSHADVFRALRERQNERLSAWAVGVVFDVTLDAPADGAC